MSHLIQDSIRDGSCTLYHDYRAGHLLDLSGHGHNGVGTNIVLGPNGLRPTYLTNGRVTVADCTLFDSNKTGTIFVLVDGQQFPNILARPSTFWYFNADSGERAWNYFSNYVGRTCLYYLSDSSNNRTSSLLDPTARKGHCVTFQTNQLSKFYLDGLYFSDGNANNVFTNDLGNGDFIIGSHVTLPYYNRSTIQAVYVNKTVLTASQVRDLYLELLK